MAKRKDLIINQTNDDYDAKNKANTLVLEGIKSEDIISIKIDGANDLFIIETNDRTINIDNYNKIRYILPQDSLQPIDIINKSLVDNMEEITEDDRKKLKLSGTIYNDKINAIDYAVPTTGKNKDKGLTINSGEGNDEITGTLGNDTITGGAGVNTLILSGDFGKDTVILTKGETLILDLSDYNFTKIEDIDFDASDKKNLILTVKDNLNVGGTLVLKNYTKQNLKDTKVLLNLGDEDNMTDLATLDLYEYGKDKFSKGVFKGTRFSETIDASGFTTALGKKNKGVTIDGGAGYNTIIGTNGFNDTIKGGNDGNDITAGDGNKTVTTGSGADKITITGDGTHTIKAGAGENEITIKGDGKTAVTTGADKDVINVENYGYDTNISAGNGKNEITATTGGGITTIKSGKDDDTINISGYATTNVYAGGGENTINIDSSDDFGKITIFEEKLNATNIINFTSDSNFYLTKKGNDLIIIQGTQPMINEEGGVDNDEEDEDVSSVTIKEYFKENSKYADYIFKIDDGELSFENFAAISGGLYVTGKGTIRGTENDDNIYYGGKGSVNIYAGDGDDTISVGTKDSKIYTGEGEDSVYAYEGSVYFYAGDGYDTVYEAKNLIFEKGTQLELSIGWSNNLKIMYGDGDVVYLPKYSVENDERKYIYIGNKREKISSLLKNMVIGETIYVGEEKVNQIINGTDKMDTFNIYGKDNTIYAGDGEDIIISENASNTLYGGTDNDYFYAKNDCTIYGEEGNDKINAFKCTVYGGADNDDIHAKNSTIYGGDGNDSITGVGSTIYGGEGSDHIDAVNSTVYAGKGDDSIRYSEANYDDYYYDYQGKRIATDRVNGYSGHIHFSNGDGNDTIYAYTNSLKPDYNMYLEFDDATDINDLTIAKREMPVKTEVIQGNFEEKSIHPNSYETLILDLSYYNLESMNDIQVRTINKKKVCYYVLKIDTEKGGGELILRDMHSYSKIFINFGDEDNMVDLNEYCGIETINPYENDVVIKYNNGQDSVTISDFMQSSYKIKINNKIYSLTGTEVTNVADAPVTSLTSPAPRLSIDNLLSEVMAFSTSSSDMSMNYNDIQNTDNVSALIAEYTPEQPQVV